MASTIFAETLFVDDHESIALVTLDGINDVIRNEGSDMTYTVTGGSGKFYIGRGPFDSEVVDVIPGSVVEIPRGSTYQDIGSLTMLATARPPFDQSKVRIIKHRN